MAITPHFFNKREPESTPLRTSVPLHSPSVSSSSSSSFSPHPSVSAVSPSVAVEPAPPPSATPPEGGSKLTVGPNIKLKGVEITDCDTLVVEGTVEATMDSRLMQIAQQGAFKGSADIDIAEIHGKFDGDLTVREKLTIFATGKVTGKVRYGKVVIEEGGQLSGDIQFGALTPAAKLVGVERSGVHLTG
jgi:cytoskeletal protein CcmA (bactofilin family)